MDKTIAIPAQLRDALPSVMAAHGYRTLVVDRCPLPAGESMTQRRYICGKRINAVLVTVKDSQLEPALTWATVGTDFWLLARYGKITFDYDIVQQVFVALAGSAWIIEHAESGSEVQQVEAMLRGMKPPEMST